MYVTFMTQPEQPCLIDRYVLYIALGKHLLVLENNYVRFKISSGHIADPF